MDNKIIQQQLMTYLQIGNNASDAEISTAEFGLIKAERAVSFDVIFSSDTKPFTHIKDEKSLLTMITKLTSRFIKSNFVGENADSMALQFALDVVESKPDWRVLDILNLFKFIRQRQDIEELRIFGNKISPMKLMSLVAVYENHKSEARELYQKKIGAENEHGVFGNQKLLGESKEAEQSRKLEVAEQLNKMTKKLKQIEDDKADNVFKNANKTKEFLRAVENDWNNQISLVEQGKQTEEDAIINHVEFRKNYQYANHTNIQQ
ncbi:MAG: hypothetical protein KDE33_19425 [Bacteroidetes bacterium]|nr:hypothetical protein [Bacteroidota bacterium]